MVHVYQHDTMTGIWVNDIVEKYRSQDNLGLKAIGINTLLEQRSDTKRKDLTLALKLGRLLYEVRDAYKRGEWGEWVLSNTTYSSMAEAQADMRLWGAWRDRIIDQYGDSNVAIERFVSGLSDKNVSVSVSSLHVFARDEVPEYARVLAIQYMTTPEVDKMTSQISKKIVEAAQAIEELPSDTQKTVKEIVVKWGIQNPDVINQLPTIANKHPDMLETILESGVLSVPLVNGGEGDEIPIDRVSRTDIALAMGEAKSEATLTRVGNYTSQLDFIKQFEGATVQELVEMLQAYIPNEEINVSNGEKYQLRLYKKTRRK